MGARSEVIAHVTAAESPRYQDVQMTRIGNSIKLGIVVVWADPLHPVIDTGRRGLAGHLFDISDMDIALLINSVPKPLFGPARFRQDFSSLRIEHEDMRGSRHAIALDIICYGR